MVPTMCGPGGYFVATSDVVSDEMPQRDVRNPHEGTAPEEDFTTLNPSRKGLQAAYRGIFTRLA
jgi:hypothetical protein